MQDEKKRESMGVKMRSDGTCEIDNEKQVDWIVNRIKEKVNVQMNAKDVDDLLYLETEYINDVMEDRFCEDEFMHWIFGSNIDTVDVLLKNKLKWILSAEMEYMLLTGIAHNPLTTQTPPPLNRI